MGKFTISLFLILLFGCGSKKKSLEITKDKKDLTVFNRIQKNTIVDFSSELLSYKFTPGDPKLPITINDSIKIQNAVIEVKNKIVDSVAKEEVREETKIEDKSKTKNKVEVKDKKVRIPWWQWIILILGFLVAALVLYFRATGKRIKLPKLF